MPQSPSAFYQLLDQATVDGTTTETFTPTEHTTGPWGPMQHGGPVAALLTRSMERLGARPDTRISRVTVDLLGPVPMDQLRVTARIVRPGRRIELLAATLEAPGRDGQWQPVAQGSAWRLATQPTKDVVRRADGGHQLPAEGPTSLEKFHIPDIWPRGGFVGATDWRVVHPGGEEGVPTIVWIDLMHDLVAGEPITGLERAMVIADTANGVGARLDPERFSFLNTELTVHLHHPPTGTWFGVEAETSVGPDGVGMSAGVLHSADGPIGRVTQSLLVERFHQDGHGRVES